MATTRKWEVGMPDLVFTVAPLGIHCWVPDFAADSPFCIRYSVCENGGI